jgi:hypothetical protein
MEDAHQVDDAIMAYREEVGKTIVAYREEVGEIIQAIPPQIFARLVDLSPNARDAVLRPSAMGAHLPLLGPPLLVVSVVLQPISTIRVPSRSTSEK